ncbi:MAG: hypothetical protein ACN4E2_05690 [Nitrospinota bacterium]
MCRYIVGAAKYYKSLILTVIIVTLFMPASVIAKDKPSDKPQHAGYNSIYFGLEQFNSMSDLFVQVSKGGSKDLPNIGSRIDLVNLLGFDDNYSNYGFNAIFPFGSRSSLTFDYISFASSSSKTLLEESIVFNETTYTINDNITHDFVSSIGGIGYNFNIIQSPRFVFGAGVGLNAFHIDMQLYSELLDEVESFEIVTPIPLLTATTHIQIFKWATIRGKVGHISYYNSTLVKADGILDINLGKNISLFAGYKLIDISYQDDHENDEAEFKWSGPKGGIYIKL